MNKIYLDYAASTPVRKEVLDAMFPYFSEYFGNASSVHRSGQKTRVAIESSREMVAGLLNCSPGELFFTSGGTESINFALMGITNYLWRIRKTRIISSEIEHKAAIETLKFLKTIGFEVLLLKPDKNGIVSKEIVKEHLNERTGLISIMHINNETGHINPVHEIGELATEYGVLFHTDLVQSFGKFKVNTQEIKADLMSFSGHKFFGPKGIGIIYIKSGTEINPIIFGGAQERKKRGGTENVPNVVGIAKAAEFAINELEFNTPYVSVLKKYLHEKLTEKFPEDVVIISDPEFSSPYIFNFSFYPEKFNLTGETLNIQLDLEGIEISNGSACSSGTHEPSHVIKGLGYTDDIAKNSIRVSFSKFNSMEELDYFILKLERIFNNSRIK